MLQVSVQEPLSPTRAGVDDRAATPDRGRCKARAAKSLLVSGAYYPPHRGGISNLMSGIASALGPDSICCLTGQLAGDLDLCEMAGPKVYRRPALFDGTAKYLQAASWASTIAEIMIRERPQIVQIATAAETSIGIWLRQWLRLPYVAYAHGNEVLSAMQASGDKSRQGLIQADRVIAVSRFTADLVENAGVSPERIEVVHPGCDSHRFRPLRPTIDVRQKFLGDRYRNRVLLTVGNVMARKGHDMVIRVLPRLRRSIPDITYLIVGPCSRPNPLESLAKELGVRDCVIFASDVSAEDLPRVYSLADVFVMPSRQELEACDVEGFGLVFLEASACAKPVVGGRSGGIPDAIAEGTTGLLVNPTDHEEIAAALERLLTDRDLASRLGQQGRSWVVEHFGWPRVAERVRGILHAVLEEKAVGALHRFTASPRKRNFLGKNHGT